MEITIQIAEQPIWATKPKWVATSAILGRNLNLDQGFDLVTSDLEEAKVIALQIVKETYSAQQAHMDRLKDIMTGV